MKFTTISKIPNISQMLIIHFLSMHYTMTRFYPNISVYLFSIIQPTFTANLFITDPTKN